MVEVLPQGEGHASGVQGTTRPRRILLRLEDDAGSVQGEYAQSSDVVAFRKARDQGGRRVAISSVTGTLVGPQLRLRFIDQTGRRFEVDAIVNSDGVVGTYTVLGEAEGGLADAGEAGTIDLKRD